MSPVAWNALCRAWHRKTRRPVPGVAMTVDEDFFRLPSDRDTNNQHAFAAGLGRAVGRT